MVRCSTQDPSKRFRAIVVPVLQMPNKLARYVEWQSGGRRTGRVAYVIGKQHLPEPIAGAEWQIDSKFNVSEEILRDPTIKAAFKAAIANGVEMVLKLR